MSAKKGFFVAVLTIISISFTTSSFAMMGGHGGYGSYSTRQYSGDHSRYYEHSDTRSFSAGIRMQDYYGRAYDGNVRLRYEDNGGYYDRYSHHNYVDGYSHHYTPSSRIEFSINTPGGYGYYHHNH